ncbi:globin-like [Limulus polyphemus]|uniref:Globin-like n=1 Tax=Limulus polyphemus TaxID=6850 RepID=A0ABM1B6Y9_LIMPO|nr:globin-like [Limulus polyphemus]
MGGVVSYFWQGESPDIDIPDEGTGLSLRDKQNIRKTWSIVQKDLKGNGIELFVRLFEEYPEYRKLFKSLANIPWDQLRDSKKLEVHAMSVMYAISSLVDSLDDVSCLIELLKKTGENHRRHRTTVEQFENLAVVMVNMLQDVLGSYITLSAVDSWKKALAVMINIIKEGLGNTENDN